LRDQFHIPGTRVLQFAFDGNTDNPYLPNNFVPNTVVYTGTHDNAPTRQWYEESSSDQRRLFWSYLKRPPGERAEADPEHMPLAWLSIAGLAIAPLQDLLNLGNAGRMNVPGRADGNWSWRCSDEMLSTRSFQWLRDLTLRSKRLEGSGVTQTAEALEAVS